MFSSSVLGIEINKNLIKIAEYDRRHKELINIFTVPIQGRKKDSTKKAEKLKEALQNKRIKTKKVVSNITAKNVLIRYVTLPDMSLKQIQEAVKWEINEYVAALPYEDTMLSDYQVVGKINCKGIDQKRVLFTVLPKKYSQNLLNILLKARLKPLAFEIKPISLLRVFSENYNHCIKGISAVINIDFQHTDIIIVEDGKLKTSRLLNIEFNDTTNEKCSKTIQNIIPKVHEVFAFFIKSYGGIIKTIYLSGEAVDNSCIKLFKQNFNLNTVMLDPLKKIKLSNKINKEIQNKQRFSAVIGMALRGE